MARKVFNPRGSSGGAVAAGEVPVVEAEEEDATLDPLPKLTPSFSSEEIAETDVAPVALAQEIGIAEVEVLAPEEDLIEVEDAALAIDPRARESRFPVIPKSESKALVPLDALSLYLREISKYPALTREEEHELAVHYRETKDVDAAYKLIASNLWLVVKLARDYEKATRNLLDLVQEGNIGLMEAVKNYDPYRGVRLPSYAVWWIKAYLVRYLIANWRMVRIGTTQAQRKLFFNLKKEKEKLERSGFSPTPKLIADKLNVRESDVVEMEQRMGSSDLSVDAPLQSDSDSNLLSVLPSSSASAEELLSQKQMKTMVERTLREFASTLKEKELIIFTERMLAEDKATLQDISDKVKVSRERVRQIENRVRDKLKSYFEERFGATLDQLDF